MKAKLIKTPNESIGYKKGDEIIVHGFVIDTSNRLLIVSQFRNKIITVPSYLVEVYD